jgi:hypothetical protein
MIKKPHVMVVAKKKNGQSRWAMPAAKINVTTSDRTK